MKVSFTMNDLLKSQSVDSIVDELNARRGKLMSRGQDPFSSHVEAQAEIHKQAQKIVDKRKSGDLSKDTIPYGDASNKMFAKI